MRIPSVSVVLPTYNRAEILGRSVQSVLSQSFADFELIIIDDASEDGTSSVVNSFEDGRIRYIKNKKNIGGAESRNVGIKNARAQLIAFQDSDDEWRPIKLRKCLKELEKNRNILGVYSAYWQINGKTVRYSPIISPPRVDENMTEALLWGNFVGTPTVVVYKEALNACGGFDKDMPRYQDWELFIRLSAQGSFLFIDEPLVLSYFTPNSISSNVIAHQYALKRIYEKNKERIKVNKKLEAIWYARIGDMQLKAGSPQKGRKNLLRSFRTDPLNIRLAIRAFFSVFGNKFLYSKASMFFEKSKLLIIRLSGRYY